MKIDISGIPLFAAPFYFVRHGESESNLRDTVAGTLDVFLTAKGRSQAEEAAGLLVDKGCTAIYSSALIRARDTAAAITRRLNLPVTIIPELGERNWGRLEGRPRSERAAAETFTGVEPSDKFMQRVLCGLRSIPAGGLPVIVSHSGVFRVLLKVLNVPPSSAAMDGSLFEEQGRVTNGRPVCLFPPALAGGHWQAEPI